MTRSTARHTVMVIEGSVALAGVGIVAGTSSDPSCGDWDFTCPLVHDSLSVIGPMMLIGGLVAILVTAAAAPPDPPAVVAPKVIFGPPGGSGHE